jgi:hypothetical protein
LRDDTLDDIRITDEDEEIMNAFMKEAEKLFETSKKQSYA